MLNSTKSLKTIIFPESYDVRVQAAVKDILAQKIAGVILISVNDTSFNGIPVEGNLKVIPVSSGKDFLNEFHQIKCGKDLNRKITVSIEEIKDPLTLSCMLLRNNIADGIIAGSNYTTSEVLKNAISIIGTRDKIKTVSSFFMISFPSNHILKNKILAFADCGVVPFPTSEQLSDIAIQTSENYRKLTGKIPKVAFLSFSTKGSSNDKSLERINEALRITLKRKPGLICDGELQFDAAFIPEIAKRKNPKGKIKGDANVFIFPDLNSGNIAYKIAERIGGAQAVGPVLQGLAKPVMDLSRGCTKEDIVNMTNVIVKF